MRHILFIAFALAVSILGPSASLLPANAVAVCGNGNFPCPDPDRDNDGHMSTSAGGDDCDDNDYRIYAGVVTSSGCPAGQSHSCQANGSYTACSAGLVCEAAAGSTCKYVDCASGSDSNDGSSASPWRSFKNVGYYAGSHPANWYQLQPGDVVYLTGSGTCSDWYNPGGGEENTMAAFSASGTASKPITVKRYPGSTAVMSSPFSASTPGHIFRLLNLSYFKLDDLDVTGGYGSAIYLGATQDVEISRVKCYGVRGSNNYNVACINSAQEPTRHYVHHNELSDVYDTSQPGAENVSLVVYFGGSDNRFEYNRMFYSNAPNYGGPIVGRCFKYKHPALTGTETFKGNQLWNCNDVAVTNSAINFHMDHNLFVNPASTSLAVAYYCGDVGAGISYCSGGLIEYNTIVNMRPVSFRISVNAGLGSTTFSNNVVEDAAPAYGSENGFFRIERYGSDAEYAAFRAANALVSDHNCFYNSSTPLMFDFFGDSAAATGGNVNLSGWTALGYDTHSFVGNPQFDGTMRAQSPNCSGFGWNVENGGSSGRPRAPTGLTAAQVP